MYQIYTSLCVCIMHVWLYICRHVHMPVDACEPSLILCCCTYIWYVIEQIWIPHSKYEPNSHHTKWTYRPKIFACLCQNTTNHSFYFTCYCHICASNKHASQLQHICHIWICSSADMKQYFIWTCYNQQCNQKHWYTHISQSWQMPLKICLPYGIYISQCMAGVVYI